ACWDDDAASALKEFETALQVTERLIQNHPEHPARQYERYVNVASIALLLRQRQDLKGAEGRYREAKTTIERLVTLYPEVGFYQRELATIDLQIVKLPGQEDPKLQLASLQQALGRALKSVELSPQDGDAHTEVARIHYEIALRRKADSPAEALKGFQQSAAAAESA